MAKGGYDKSYRAYSELMEAGRLVDANLLSSEKIHLVTNTAVLNFKKKEELSPLSPSLRTALADPGEYFPKVCIPFFVRTCQLCTGSDTVINGNKREKINNYVNLPNNSPRSD